MKKKYLRLMAALFAALMLLSGCADTGGSLRDFLREEYVLPEAAPGGEVPVHFSQFQYVRPDMDALRGTLDAALAASRDQDAQAIMEKVYAFYDAYDWFYTYYYLADIHYSQDLTNTYWSEEYSFCAERSAELDGWLEELYYTLAESPAREDMEDPDYFGDGFFDSYDGENNWDEAFTQLLQQEAELQNQYYELIAEPFEGETGTPAYDAYARPIAQVLADLVTLRREIARYWGYDSYVEFAWDFYYYRDYTPQEMESYCNAISRELVPIYREMAGTNVWDYSYYASTEDQTMDYVRSAARNMGGEIADAFCLMEERGLCDISYGENKYATSFEVYLTSYQVPFVFLCPYGEVYDRLTFAHEFGHFANDYASGGSYAGVDVLEVFSQGMEFLCLAYGPEDEDLVRVKLADSLSTYVEQAAFTDFELAIYSLEDWEITVEGLCRTYDRTAREFGFESVGYDNMEFVTISHFYTNPLYVPGYVVSNDAALQLYLRELEKPGMGLKRYLDTLDTEQTYFLNYLKEARLTNPFEPGQLEKVRDLFRERLLN